MITAQQLTTPSWTCIHFADPPPSWPETVAACRGEGVLTAELDAQGVSGKADLLRVLGEVWEFPDYYGANWDAFEECLRDLSWLPAKGYVLVMTNASSLWRDHPRLSGQLVQSWLFCAEEWSQQNVPCHLVFFW